MNVDAYLETGEWVYSRSRDALVRSLPEYDGCEELFTIEVTRAYA